MVINESKCILIKETFQLSQTQFAERKISYFCVDQAKSEIIPLIYHVCSQFSYFSHSTCNMEQNRFHRLKKKRTGIARGQPKSKRVGGRRRRRRSVFLRLPSGRADSIILHIIHNCVCKASFFQRFKPTKNIFVSFQIEKLCGVEEEGE